MSPGDRNSLVKGVPQGGKQASPRMPTQAHGTWLHGAQAEDTHSGDSVPQLTCDVCCGCRRANSSACATFLTAGLGTDGQSAIETVRDKWSLS